MADADSAPAGEDSALRFVSVVAGGANTCALLSDGRALCWGLACTTDDPRRRDPVECFGRQCELDDDGAISCSVFGGWQGMTPSDTSTAGPGAGPYRELAVTQDFGCGLLDGGELHCWGVPVFRDELARYAHFSLGFCMGCGLRLDGSVHCPHACLEAAAPPSEAVTMLSAGYRHACGVLESTAALTCWGAGRQARAPDAAPSEDCPSFPQACGQAAPPSGEFRSVASGRFHSCGIGSDGELRCWGLGTSAQDCSFESVECGQASPPSGSFVAVSAGVAHTCGIRDNGELACWGAGSGPRRCEPDSHSGLLECGQALPPAGEFVAVTAGTFHNCALSVSGEIECWGLGDSRGACFTSSRDQGFDYECGQALPPRLPTP